MKFQKNDKVRVVRKAESDAEPMEPEYMGRTGIVVKSGSGKSVGTMIIVDFGKLGRDAFWPEELERLK